MGKKADSKTCKVCHKNFEPDHTFVVKSERCPHCGAPVTNERAHNPAAVALVAALICLVAGACVWVAF